MTCSIVPGGTLSEAWEDAPDSESEEEEDDDEEDKDEEEEEGDEEDDEELGSEADWDEEEREVLEVTSGTGEPTKPLCADWADWVFTGCPAATHKRSNTQTSWVTRWAFMLF